MKKLVLLLMCAVVLLGTFTACSEDAKETATNSATENAEQSKDYLGKYYAPGAEVMGSKATVEFFEDGTFVMVSEYEKNKSTITGSYSEFSSTQLLLIPSEQVLNENGKKSTNDMSQAASILAEIKGDELVFSNGTTEDVIYRKIK